jgi:hypothetical protein
MTYNQMIVATGAGFLYGPVLWFLSDFSILIKNHLEKDLTGLFTSCGLYTNILFASYAHYFIVKTYGLLLSEERRPVPASLIHFGFLFPSLIVYPSEGVCYLWSGPSSYWFQRILFSHPAMICIVLFFETVGLHGLILSKFKNPDGGPGLRRL